jgi:Zn-dependent peptidase ImmA (M78 family)
MNQLKHSEKEKNCNAFASEMLLSKANLEMELGNSKRSIFLEEIKNLQEKYGISVAAIIYKLEETGYLSKYNLRDFFIRMNSDSDFKQKIEQSRYLGTERSNRFENLVFRALSQETISLSKASSILDIPLSDLKSVLLQAV